MYAVHLLMSWLVFLPVSAIRMVPFGFVKKLYLHDKAHFWLCLATGFVGIMTDPVEGLLAGTLVAYLIHAMRSNVACNAVGMYSNGTWLAISTWHDSLVIRDMTCYVIHTMRSNATCNAVGTYSNGTGLGICTWLDLTRHWYVIRLFYVWYDFLILYTPCDPMSPAMP